MVSIQIDNIRLRTRACRRTQGFGEAEMFPPPTSQRPLAFLVTV